MAYSLTGEIFNASDQRRFENMMKLLLFLEAELQLKEEIIDLLLVCIVQCWCYFYLVYLKVAKVYTELPIASSERATEETLMLHIVHWRVQDSFNMNVLFQTEITLWRSFFPIIWHVNSFPLRSSLFEFWDFFSPFRSRKYERPYRSFENIQSNTPYITLRNKHHQITFIIY